MNSRRAGLLLVFVLAIGASIADAQVNQAELRGTVVDESRAALPGVAVTATNLETGASRSTVTSETGTYLMPALPIGGYKVTVELAGFATIVQEGVRLGVGESVVAHFTMKVASLQETLTVVGESALIDTKQSDLGGRVQTSQIETLPLNGRNWLDLVALVPGTRGNPGQIGAGSSGNDASRYQMDGISVTGQGTGGETQSYSHETIAEFQVLTNRFSAEYGRVTGAVINAVSKSGTNQFRGSGLFYIRNDRFDGENFFTHRVAPFDEKQSGFTVGGPIVRDRAHFFGAYEYQKRSITAIPTTGIPQFDIEVDNGIQRKLPSFRVDLQLAQNHRAFVRASAQFHNSQNNGVGGSTNTTGNNTSVSAGNNEDFNNYDLSIGETWVISNRMVHEVRAGVFYFYRQLYESAAMPRYAFPSVLLGPATNVPQWWREKIFQASNSLSYFLPGWHGEHKIKAGFQYILPYYQGELPKISYGAFNFDRNPPDYNDMTTWPRPTRYTTTLGDFSYNVNNPIYAGFLQDDWTLNAKLTLNLGVRYDVEPRVTNKHLADPLDESPRRIDGDNIAPRFGFAYDLRGNGRTVIRGGIGRYYGNILLNIPMNEARDRNRRVSVTVLNPNLIDPLSGLTLEEALARQTVRSRVVMDSGYDTPVQDQVSIGLGQQVGDRFGWEADYVHSDGRHLQMSRNINFFEDPVLHVPLNPTIYGRPYPQFSDITRYETWGQSRYDGLQLGFTGRRTDGHPYEIGASYTLSSAKGDTNANRFGVVNNPFNLADEYSYLTTDQRHRFYAHGTVYLPWSFQVATIFFAGSPKPLDIQTNRDPFGSGPRRWLDATGAVLPKNGERMLKSDYKLDLRLVKSLRLGRASVQGAVDVFNLLNTENWGSYGTTFGSSTYLVAGSSTNLFYQPRQVQFGVRVTY